MAAIKITTNFNIDLEFTPAPFHRRLFAWMLDIIVIFFYIYIAIKCIEWIAESRIFRNENSSEGIWAIMMVLMLPILTYHLIMEVMLKGQSVGKRIMGLRVISENGGKPSISQYIIRWLIRTSDYMIVIIALNAPTGFGSGASFIWQIGAAFGLLMTDIILVNSSQKSQRLGDM
ncbi:MAG TPA: RDD family protein, partial [Flavisolibacter sp.]|nr:RDD family protein [Flavisolibacter sp.]